MKQLLVRRSFYVYVALAVIIVVLFMAVSAQQRNPVNQITTEVEYGTVEQLVSVSGIIEAEQTAELAFPVSGIVADVGVKKGDIVEAGDVLIKLEARALEADRADAVAARERAIATRNELQTGADPNTRSSNAETITLKEATLATTKATQADLVANAYRTLLSSDLAAESTDSEEEAAAPIVTGTYACEEEGAYTIEVYRSGTNSGYSYRLTGLETGAYPSSVEQPAPLGSCGLRIQFTENESYNNSTWVIEIPNTQSSQYVKNRNAYVLAKTQAESAIALAEQDVILATANATQSNAPARAEAIARANADITSANARIARVDAQLADRVMRAPFAGTITDIDILPGETVTTVPVVTLLADADFELTARIPEIDIGRLELGQTVTAVFDAKLDEPLNGTVDFIALKATEIDGVAYYEAIITLEETPQWVRSGLNADIDIVVARADDVLRLPTRFVNLSDNDASVLRPTDGEKPLVQPINILLDGDDGYIAIDGLNEGDQVIAP